MNKQNGIGSVMSLSPSEFEAVVKVYNMQNGTKIASGGRPSAPTAKKTTAKPGPKPKASGAASGEKRVRGPNGLTNTVREYLRANADVVMSDAIATLTSQGLDKDKVRQAIYVLKSSNKVSFDGKGHAAKIKYIAE